MKYVKSVLAWLFEGITRFRTFLYQRQILKTNQLPYPVICVGNLTLGGTGKTPLVAYLAIRLKEAGFTPAVLSRGYRGSLRSSALVVSNGSEILTDPKACGDEPYLLARKLEGVFVSVGRQRYRAGLAVGKLPGKPVFILDDGFQHLRLERDIDLLLIDGSRVLKDEALLPKGRLREPLSAIARADAVVITREHLSPDLKQLAQEIRAWNPTAPVFPFWHEIEEIYDLKNGTRHTLAELRGREVVALAGIGNPAQFLEDLRLAGIIVKDQVLYPDHHHYSQRELDEVLGRCREAKAVCVLTTEKDAVRLKDLELGIEQVLAVSIKAQTRDPASFMNWVLHKLEKKYSA
jgi:tetraacyldisaccharide 4'-kinase